jgi:hypothetical protein
LTSVDASEITASMLQINTGASVMHRHRLVNVVDAWSGRQVDGDAGGEIGRSSAVNGRLYQASNKQGRPDNPIRLAMFSSAVAGVAVRWGCRTSYRPTAGVPAMSAWLTLGNAIILVRRGPGIDGLDCPAAADVRCESMYHYGAIAWIERSAIATRDVQTSQVDHSGIRASRGGHGRLLTRIKDGVVGVPDTQTRRLAAEKFPDVVHPSLAA